MSRKKIHSISGWWTVIFFVLFLVTGFVFQIKWLSITNAILCVVSLIIWMFTEDGDKELEAQRQANIYQKDSLLRGDQDD